MRQLKNISYMILFAVLTSCVGTSDRYVASVDGEKISRREFRAELRSTLAKYDPEAANKERLEKIKNDLLEDMIKDRILFNKAKEAGIKISGRELDSELNDFKSRYTETSFRKMLSMKGTDYDDWKKSVERSIYIDKFIESIVLNKKPISDRDILSYYKKHKSDFRRPEEVHVRQIVVDDEETAEALRKRALKGETFSELAMENSIAPEARKGGDLGWFAREIMPKEFDSVCFRLKNGEISPVVKTEFGYHLFKLVEKKAPAEMSFEQAKEKIRMKMAQKRGTGDFDAWYADQRTNSDVKIDQEAVSNIDPFEKENK